MASPMSHDETSAIVLSIVFAIILVYSAFRGVIAVGWIDRVSNLIHAVMALVMLAMPWSWYALFPTGAQIVFFTAAAFWYIFLALFRPHAPAAPELSHHAHAGLLWYHAGMMAAMVWMAIAMSPLVMSGMDHMSGMGSMPGMPHGQGMAGMTGAEPWATTVSIVCGIFFALAGLWFLVAGIRTALRLPGFSGRNGLQLLDILVTCAMAGGMSASFLLLMI